MWLSYVPAPKEGEKTETATEGGKGEGDDLACCSSGREISIQAGIKTGNKVTPMSRGVPNLTGIL